MNYMMNQNQLSMGLCFNPTQLTSLVLKFKSNRSMSIIVYIDPDIQRVIKTSPDDVADLRRFEPSGSPSENLTGSGTGFWSLSPILGIKTSIFSITGLFWLTSENIGIGSVIKIITSWKIYISSVFLLFLQNDDKISCWVENDLNSQEPQPNEYANLHVHYFVLVILHAYFLHTCVYKQFLI